MADFKIILAPTLTIAKEVAEKGDVVASVEAEYGDVCIEGRELTLAHHGSRSGNPAPCDDPRAHKLEGGITLVSHLDLDTLGGIMALEGKKPQDDKFWAGAEYIDVRGPHHLYELDQDVQDKLNAWYAWSAGQPRAPRYTEATDVTEDVNRMMVAITAIIGGDDVLVEAGRLWRRQVTDAVEECLLTEDEHVRVFRTSRVFCNSAYFSPKRGKVIPAIVTLNDRYGSITVSFADDVDSPANACEIVQALWGPEAGGRAGIAGSPRGKKMKEEDLLRAVHAVENLFEKEDI